MADSEAPEPPDPDRIAAGSLSPAAEDGRMLPARVVFSLVGVGVVLGVAADVLLFVPAPGLGVGLFAALWFFAVLFATRINSWSAPHRWTWPLLAGSVVFAAGIAVRDSPWLVGLDVAGWIVAVLVASLRMTSGRLLAATFQQYLAGVVELLARAAVDAGVLLWPAIEWEGIASDRVRTNARSVVRGGVLAVLCLVVFGQLLVAADARFERLVVHVLDLPDSLGVHVSRVLAGTWLAVGALCAIFLRGAPDESWRTSGSRSSGVEALIVLGSLNVLFAIFVVLQLETLFGGMHHVLETSHLTLAQYARRGFFQLVVVAALVMPVLAVASRFGGEQRRLALVHRLSWLTVALVFVIMASALQRLWLYQETFGITELRFYSTAFVIWLFAAFIVFGATVLRDREEQFTFPLVLTAFAAVVALNVANPDAIIARIDMHRASQHTAVGFDPSSVTQLSADAVPTIVARLDSVPEQQRIVIEHDLAGRGLGPVGDWRSWNLGRSKAEQALR